MGSMGIEVIYEDDAVLAVNKPAGLAVHADGRSVDTTVVDWVRAEHPGIVGVGESMRLQDGSVIDRPGIVHRLDRETSGVLIIAKTQPSFEHLKRQFKDRLIEKQYHAFVWGELRDVCGTVDRPIGRSRKDFRLWSAGNDAGGQLRPATTRYTRLAVRDGFSYVALEPKTGRTHQIRVHMKTIGHPLLCDTRYAPKKPFALGFERLALHALTLTLTHPNGTNLVLEAPLPEDFARAVHNFGR